MQHDKSRVSEVTQPEVTQPAGSFTEARFVLGAMSTVGDTGMNDICSLPSKDSFIVHWMRQRSEHLFQY